MLLQSIHCHQQELSLESCKHVELLKLVFLVIYDVRTRQVDCHNNGTAELWQGGREKKGET